MLLSIGAVVLLALGVLSQLFDFIPKTALAAIIIAAVLYMVDVKILHKIWKVKSKLMLTYTYITWDMFSQSSEKGRVEMSKELPHQMPNAFL